MKIVEALKKIKALEKKAEDLKIKIGQHCVDMDYETPMYQDQSAQVSSWMQSYSDTLREINQLSHRLQKTNVMTMVKIELEGRTIEKSIFEWIQRRRKLAAMECAMYEKLTDKGLKEGAFNTSGGQTVPAKIRRYYSPSERDKKISALKNEPFEIDGRLEIINATTDLLD